MDDQKVTDESEIVVYTDTIGKTIQSDKYQIMMDEFWFSIFDGNIVEPFDFISVENIHNTVTIGIVKELRTIRNNDVTISKQTESQVNNNSRDSKKNTETYVDQGRRIARVVVMANAHIDNIQLNSKTKYKENIRMPVI